MEAVGLELVEEEDRDLNGHSRLVRVYELQVQTVVVEAAGEGVQVHLVGLGPVHRLLRKVQQLRSLVADLLPPGVERSLACDAARKASVEERDQLVIGGAKVATTRAVLEVRDLLQASSVALVEVMAGTPVALHQRSADELLTGVGGIDLRVQDSAVCDQRHPEQRYPLCGHRGALFRGPHRLRVGALDQMGAQILGPRRVDPRRGPGPEPGRVDQFGGHHQGVVLLEESRAGKHRESGAARALIVAGAGLYRPMWESR